MPSSGHFYALSWVLVHSWPYHHVLPLLGPGLEAGRPHEPVAGAGMEASETLRAQKAMIAVGSARHGEAEQIA